MLETTNCIETNNEKGLPAPLWHFASFVLAFLYFGGVIPGSRHLYQFLHLGHSAAAIFGTLISLNILFTLYALWGFRLTGRKWRLFTGESRSWRPATADILIGIALGLGLMVTSIVIGTMIPGGRANIAPQLAKTGFDRLVGLVAISVASICEEIQDRGYFLQQFLALTRNTGFAVVLQAIWFVMGHGLDQGLAGYLARFVIGVAFGAVAIHRDSLWPSVIAHSLINIVAFIAAVL